MYDILGYIAAFLTTFAFLPQAVKTYKTKSTGDLSPVMFFVLVIGVIGWLIYGIILVNWPMILANSVTLSLNFIILYYVIKNKINFKIEHVAIWVKDLETMKTFYITNFRAEAGKEYSNEKNGFRSCFITLSNGARIELMSKDKGMPESYAHLAISTGSIENVDEITSNLSKAGYNIVSQPRTTGDGYYESVIEDPEKNLIEITV